MTRARIAQPPAVTVIEKGGCLCQDGRMTEIELKFQVPEGAAAAVRAAVAGRGATARTLRLQAVYFDTADGRLAAAGVALRLRREGGRWVQTLKATGADAMTRLEHEVPRRERSAATPLPELALHAGTPAGARLEAVLAEVPGATLVCRYRTDIRRTQRELRHPGALLELAFDEGRIEAGDAVLPVCELEIELLRGDPAALLSAAATWVARHGLWLDVRSKAERGTLLATGRSAASPRKAVAIALEPQLAVGVARRLVLGECVQQVLANAGQIASGEFEDDHVHQLRVGLRRLRSGIALFAPAHAAPDPLADGAAVLFRALGAARDRAAVAGPTRAQLAAALQAQGLALAAPEWPAAVGPDPLQMLRAPATQAWLLEALRAGLPDAAPDVEPVGPRLDERLAAWHRKVKRDAGRFATLDEAARHRLRKRIKRLRYGLEFARGCLGAKKSARLLAALAEAQAQLGVLIDSGVALQALRAATVEDPAVAFAIGWLAARQEVLVAACTPALAQLAEARPPWKR